MFDVIHLGWAYNSKIMDNHRLRIVVIKIESSVCPLKELGVLSDKNGIHNINNHLDLNERQHHKKYYDDVN